MKSRVKIKEPVRLREKEIANGCKSLYLDIYFKGNRRYEYLRLYLIPEKSKADKDANRQTLALANAIKSQTIIEIQNGAYNFNAPKGNVRFMEYVKNHAEANENLKALFSHLSNYEKNKSITFSNISSEWVQGFSDYLGNMRRFGYRNGQTGLAPSTHRKYIKDLYTIMNYAIKDGIISNNPVINIDLPKPAESTRTYLTLEEIEQLSATRCANEAIKRMFLFSCLTGLRFSDVIRLKWGDVSQQGEFTRIIFRQKKTKGQEYLDINPQAAELMGERGKDEDNIFPSYTQVSTNRALRDWVVYAGINKHITFHCARHTFAVLMLDIGTDIYTVSKLLGHRSIATTQIYAKVMDKNKQAAVKNIPKIL